MRDVMEETDQEWAVNSLCEDVRVWWMHLDDKNSLNKLMKAG